ncbi:hypothetical protein FQA39_LY17412 [Lamprigera yunnana]|nr:hypothetical protein FQA39_LY17412 [Lamprigera yunnana]
MGVRVAHFVPEQVQRTYPRLLLKPTAIPCLNINEEAQFSTIESVASTPTQNDNDVTITNINHNYNASSIDLTTENNIHGTSKQCLQQPRVPTSLPIKYDWYQTEATVVITILIKNVEKERSDFVYSSDSVSIKLGLPDNETHTRELKLAHEINQSECTCRVSPAKVEITLKKVEGIRWERLESIGDSESIKQIPQATSASSGPPVYPTSKPGKDWTAIERQIKEQEAKEKPEGEEALNKLFQDIYGKGDDNVKRAMNKSYMESGGTVLSTNWKEIGKDRVEVKPPDGMEWKKWESMHKFPQNHVSMATLSLFIYKRNLTLLQKITMVQSIIEKKMKILHATHINDLETVKQFDDDPEIHWCTVQHHKSGDTVMHIAARLGHVELLQHFLKSAPVDVTNKDNKTPLHEAAQFSKDSAIQLLIDSGADVNALKRSDWTPLMLTCTKITNTSYYCVKLLLENGAMVNFKNKDGWNVAHLISREGCNDILKILFTHKVDVFTRTNNGRSALHIGSLHGHLNIVQMLAHLVTEIDAVDNCGNTPLHEAVLGGHINICKYLLSNGANLYAVNKNGFGMLHLAASLGNLEVIKYLAEIFGNVQITNTNKQTPLHCAAKANHRAAYNLLITLGGEESLDIFSRYPSDYYFKI